MVDTQSLDLAIIGAGAAGYFGALRAVSLHPQIRAAIFESGRRPLEKVRVSGGGRCNVTHNCFDPTLFAQNYPRGAKELRAAFHRFQAKDTVEWFENHGVALKAEEDGRMFPVSDTSQTILDCLDQERRALNIELHTNAPISTIQRNDVGFILQMKGSELFARAVLIASGGGKSGHELSKSLGHTLSPLAPSLFTLNVPDEELRALAGISVPLAEVRLSIEGAEITAQRGALLITHWGVSGPAVLKTSAWAARELQDCAYRGTLRVNWTGEKSLEQIKSDLLLMRTSSPKKAACRANPFGISARLWEFIARRAVSGQHDCAWGQLTKPAFEALAHAVHAFEIGFHGKGQFKEEFVTCGGVKLTEIDFRRMESKIIPGLFFAGEVLDVDGITGGFNFQNAWTTGWIAGTAIAENFA